MDALVGLGPGRTVEGVVELDGRHLEVSMGITSRAVSPNGRCGVAATVVGGSGGDGDSKFRGDRGEQQGWSREGRMKGQRGWVSLSLKGLH